MRKEYSRFVNRLSKRIYPNAYKRHGKLIKETSYIEYGMLISVQNLPGFWGKQR